MTEKRRPIRVLSEEVSNKIAAGEVVERPASVVKELVENALDAGAGRIDVRIERGGKELIEVSDNGAGIRSGELHLAFYPHATSKIESIEDLVRVDTLGFRGEALPSIASVSRVEVITRTSEESYGTRLTVEFGRAGEISRVGTPVGTTVSVRELFGNTPARAKFLKSDAAEKRAIAEVITGIALSRPDVSFRLVSDGRQILHTPGLGDLASVISAVYGASLAGRIVPLHNESALGRVSGYVGLPDIAKGNRSGQTVIINRRLVQDKVVTAAVERAYRGLLQKGRYPFAVVVLELDPGFVDVNVHPAKAEVRFRDDHVVFALVSRSVEFALQTRDLSAHMDVAAGEISPAHGETAGLSQPFIYDGMSRARETARQTWNVPQAGIPRRSGDRFGVEVVLGQLDQTYIVASGPSGLILFDQHAVHERIVFDDLMAEKRMRDSIPSQSLLVPLTLEFSSSEFSLVTEHLGGLSGYGFDLEPFGGTTVLVRALPATMQPVSETELANMVLEIANGIESCDGDGGQSVSRALASIACKSAVKSGDRLSSAEMLRLIEELAGTEHPYTCPHGRPTVVRIELSDLRKRFGRPPER